MLISARVPETWNYDRVPVKTDARGRFRYRVPRAGHTVVEAMADGYAQSAPVDFTLAPSESREDIQLVLARATLRIVGHVYDATGAPLPFVQVALGQEGSKARYKQARTDAEGRFQFTGLGPGPHHLRARKARYKKSLARHRYDQLRSA